MRFFATILLLLAFIKGQTQNNKYISGDLAFGAEVVTAKQIPKEIKYDNNIQFALKWNDKNGENYFIVTISDKLIHETKPVDRDTTEIWEKYSYNVYLYKTSVWGNKPSLVNEDWRALSCRSGVLISVIKNSVSVTDIDNDSIAEVTFALRLRCKNDSVPTYTNILLRLIEFEEIYSFEGLGLEQGTINKNLNESNICCIDSITSAPPYIDSTISSKAQGLVKNFMDMESRKVLEFNESINKKFPDVFLEYLKSTWIEIVKKEFEEYQKIKKLEK